MPRIALFLAVICLFGNIARAQQSSQTHQLILQLNNEVAGNNQQQGEISSIGHPVLDQLARDYQVLKINIYRAGIHTGKYFYTLSFPTDTDMDRLAEIFVHTGEVRYAEPDYTGTSGGQLGTVPNDTYHNRQWGLHNTGNFSLAPSKAGADIEMHNAWDISQGSSDVVVAIMDSGIKLDHPELLGRIWQNTEEIAGNGLDDDNNGYADDTQGWDFVNNDNTPADDLGHGTNIAGIIGANGNNSIGYAGIDWHCRLMALKGLNSQNSGQYSWWSSALYYAADNGAHIINLSVGGSGFSQTLKDAVDYCLDKGVCLVVCMMNTNTETPYYPAAFPGVIAVGSTNPDDTRTQPFFWDAASGSNYGSHISVIAPGNYTYGLHHLSNTNYNTYWGGTSQATPHVVGVAALLLAQDPTRTPADIKNIIELTAEDQVGNPNQDTPGWDKYYGHGRLNAFKALSYKSTAVADQSTTTSMQVFPNPAHGTFSIQLPPEAGELSIINLLGQTVLRQPTGNDHILQLTLRQSGIYCIHIDTRHSHIVQKLVIE